MMPLWPFAVSVIVNSDADVGDRAVGDPVLRAVDDPAVAVGCCSAVRLLRRRVASRPRARDSAKQPSILPAASGVSHSLLLRVGAELEDRIAHERVVAPLMITPVDAQAREISSSASA